MQQSLIRKSIKHGAKKTSQIYEKVYAEKGFIWGLPSWSLPSSVNPHKINTTHVPKRTGRVQAKSAKGMFRQLSLKA